MLDGLKRLFSGAPAAPLEGWDGIAPWAASRQYTFRGVPNEGFVVDGRLGATPWRLEWGPSQRPYIQGQELRLRAELGLGSDLHLVLMNRELQETLEKAVFEQYVEGVQTRIVNWRDSAQGAMPSQSLAGAAGGPENKRFKPSSMV